MVLFPLFLAYFHFQFLVFCIGLIICVVCSCDLGSTRMGKQIWTRHLDEDSQQPGCMWGLVHVLDYHHWQRNKHEHQSQDKFSTVDWSRESRVHSSDADEAENLIVGKSSTRSRGTKIRSLKARIKALGASKESEDRRRLQRTFSIHHLESLDISVEKPSFDKGVLEIFQVDKELFSKSRSFPAVSGSKKLLKPVKLESKQTEIWSFSNRSDKGKHIPKRSSSLKESLEKYARMFENRLESRDAKLSTSKSLKLTSECGSAPVYLRRIRSLSSVVDSCYYSKDFEVLGDSVSGEASVLAVQDEKSSVIQESSFSIEPNDSKSLNSEYQPSFRAFPLDREEISDTSDCHYVRHLLVQSGIAADASGLTWHTSDQPLGPQLFEKSEACWPHEQGPMDVSWQDFYACWHHQMLFDLVNEVLVELYDLCLPYYPKALSSSCHVRPFPDGDYLVEDVCTSIGKLLNMKLCEKQSLEGIVGRDLALDRSWMNLQLETEGMALDFEDMIFDELLEEAIFS